MIKSIITGALALTTLGTGATTIALNTQNTYNVEYDFAFDATITYSVSEMLTLAIEDEYAAKATYQALLVLFPEQKILENLLLAEQKHINALLPLFDVYDVVVPVESTVPLVLSYETIQEAALDIAAKEVSNIEMYQHFLSQEDLPEDLELLFTNLVNASMHHQAAAERVVASQAGRGMFGVKSNGNRIRFAYNKREMNPQINRFTRSQKRAHFNTETPQVEDSNE